MYTLSDTEETKSATLQQTRAPRSRPKLHEKRRSDCLTYPNKLSISAFQKHYKHIKSSGLQYIWYKPPRIHTIENSAIKTSNNNYKPKIHLEEKREKNTAAATLGRNKISHEFSLEIKLHVTIATSLSY
jgi:hypothetical protein